MLRVVSIAWLLAAPMAAVAADSIAPGAQVGLADLVREALQTNPEIVQAEQRVWLMRARVPQAGALPDPVLLSGVINEGRPVPFDTLGTAEFSEAYVGISQGFPFPGKRGLREDVAQGEADAERWAYEATRRRIIGEVAARYYELHALREALDLVQQNLGLVDRLAGAARERFAVGQDTQQDVLEAEVELSRLEERRSLLEQQQRMVEVALARLLDRPDARLSGRLAPLTRTPIPNGVEDAIDQAEQASAVLQAQRLRVEAASRRVDLARRERLPDFGLELVYHDRGRRDLDPFYGLGATVTLPVYGGRKQERAIEEAQAELRAARGALSGARAELRYAVTSAHLQATTSERLLRLYDEGLLEQARLVLDSALAQYRVGRGDFASVIASWRRLLEDELACRQQLATHETAVARLAIETGSPALVPPAPLAEGER